MTNKFRVGLGHRLPMLCTTMQNQSKHVYFQPRQQLHLCLWFVYVRCVKDVNFNKHLLHLFPKKLEYTFLGGTRKNEICWASQGSKYFHQKQVDSGEEQREFKPQHLSVPKQHPTLIVVYFFISVTVIMYSLSIHMPHFSSTPVYITLFGIPETRILQSPSDFK